MTDAAAAIYTARMAASFEQPGDELPEAVVRAISDEAARALPDEACGVLLGTVSPGRIRVVAHRAVPNRSPHPERAFAIEADEILRLQREAEHERLDVVGFYHSHPRGPAAPSAADLEGALPGYLYVIVDGRTATLTSWRLREDRRAFEPADG